jgi:hypothetical protein
MMHITAHMTERLKEVMPNLKSDLYVPIPAMGGYYVTTDESKIPEMATRFMDLAIDGVRLYVFTMPDPDTLG